jgi:hypothetical protein
MLVRAAEISAAKAVEVAAAENAAVSTKKVASAFIKPSFFRS